MHHLSPRQQNYYAFSSRSAGYERTMNKIYTFTEAERKKKNLLQERPAPWTETKREDEGRKELHLKGRHNYVFSRKQNRSLDY